MTTKQETWPRRVGRGWNTSDGCRFFDEKIAASHQAQVDDPESEVGVPPASPVSHVSPDDLPEEDA